ncbi:MAG: transglycosylase SLT domain-containing protein [Nitrospira sp.]|nr:transglycosylase SLT domain-containing protein [Nitrospira sp.]
MPPKLLSDLFESLHSGQYSPEIEGILSGEHSVGPEDWNWPTLTYLLGEVHRQRGEIEQAREAFRNLASWATSNDPAGPYGDTWGGSGLAALGLWRWLQILEEHGGPDEEVDQVLKVASALQETRLFGGMVRSGLLPALPLLEEDMAKRLAHVTWKRRRDEATSLFLDFLEVDSSGKLDQIDQKIWDHMVENRLAIPERLDLFRLSRQLGLVKKIEQKEEAAKALKELWENQEAPSDVRAEAGFEWANYKRRNITLKEELVKVLTSAITLTGGEGPIAEMALYRRGMVHNLGTQNQVSELFVADMLELIHHFPTGQLADDARFQLATEYLFRPNADVNKALFYFKELRGLRVNNDYMDSAYFLAALALISRGKEDDLDAADHLLREYREQYPGGVFQTRCLFWRGRIAERRNDLESARELFQSVTDEAPPYDYYGLRARMHLEDGIQAVAMNLPEPDSNVYREVSKAYRGSHVVKQVLRNSPYHHRLEVAVHSGLYQRVLAIENDLAMRLDDIPLDQLDERRLTPAAALLLAFRQDALAAKDFELAADNWLRLTGLLGYEAKDWPTAIEMVVVRGDARPELITNLQTDPRFLATLYPNLEQLQILSPIASASWLIDGSSRLSQSLMYAVMRHESRFYKRAISTQGALGLFQFMTDLFDRFDKKWNLLERSDVSSRAEYLLNPEQNIQLWARWVSEEFPIKTRNEVATAVMKHHAGYGNVAAWEKYWKSFGAEADVEYRVETARFNATRNFLRVTLRDTMIMEAGGFVNGLSRD